MAVRNGHALWSHLQKAVQNVARATMVRPNTSIIEALSKTPKKGSPILATLILEH